MQRDGWPSTSLPYPAVGRVPMWCPVSTHQGSCVFPSDGGAKIVNWPIQQLDNNGRAFNTRSGGRYKYFVRALKNAENTLVAEGSIDSLPSYFMECLVYNVPASTLASGATLVKSEDVV